MLELYYKYIYIGLWVWLDKDIYPNVCCKWQYTNLGIKINTNAINTKYKYSYIVIILNLIIGTFYFLKIITLHTLIFRVYLSLRKEFTYFVCSWVMFYDRSLHWTYNVFPCYWTWHCVYPMSQYFMKFLYIGYNTFR